MPKVNLNQSPYFDDYNEDKKFYKILFRPERAVQARELTQMQTAIQKQIERMGKHIFEQGSQVLPGSKEGVRYINNNGFIKIPRSANADSSLELETYWLGKTIISTSGLVGIKAKVIGFREPDTLNEARLYLNYLQADNTGIGTEYVPGQSVVTEEIVPIGATISAGLFSTGFISSVIVEEGVYFFDGNFILVDQQTVFVIPADPEAQDTWNNRTEAGEPTATIGLKITESIVTSDDDETLLDNALGSPNFAAPGADRLHIDADLIQAGLNNADSDFIPLVTIKNGVVQARVIRTEYSVLEDTLARRTNDESGDYEVIPFQIQIKDFLRDEINNGSHNEAEFYYESEADAKTASVEIFGMASPGAGNFDISQWVPGTSYDAVGDETSFISLTKSLLSIQIDQGKAYVKGYEIEKLSTTVKDVPKARTLRFRNNKTIFTPLGTFVYVKNLFGALDIAAYDQVELHSKFIVTGAEGTSPGSRVGTARVLSVEFFSGVNGDPETGIYRLFLFNIQQDQGKDLNQLKSIYSSPSFTCDTVTENFRLIGSVSKSVIPSQLIGTGTSWKNDESQVLKKGDLVQVGNGPDSRIYEVTANPSNDNELAVTPNPIGAPWPDGSTIDLLFTTPQSNSRNAGLVFNLPDDFVYSVRSGEQGFVNTGVAGIDTVYTSRRVVGNGVSPVANQLVFTVSGTEEFDDFNTSGYVVINLGTGDWLELLPYTAGLPAAGTAEVQALGANLTIYLNAADAVGNTFYVLAPIIHGGGASSQERAKVLHKGTFPGGVYSGPSAVSNGSEVSEVSLAQADILRITRVVESPDYDTLPSDLEVLPAGHRDITGLYILDNGERDHFYDIGRVLLRPGLARPRGQVRIEFDYFTHGSSGNYFSVDSYPFKGPGKAMEYEDIPDFTASDGTHYDLTSAIDFRPRVNAGGEPSGFATSLELPKENFRADYHFYEGRSDKLFLDKTGFFLVKSGNPDVKPTPPDDPETGMVIYELSYGPYTANSGSVSARKRDNRRFTMRDIGKLEARIKNLEYYTTLSLLEKDTKELLIQDAQGNDKFKNGFLVDNFSTYGACDLGSSDFKAALARTQQLCRPIIFQDNAELFEKILLAPSNERDSLRAISNYQKTGDYYTLPYSTTVMVEQTKASKVSNVNPYAVFTFVGSLELNPWSDEWRDLKDLEPLNIQDQGAWEAAQQSFGPTGTTIDYEMTENNWTGVVISEPTPTGREVLEIAGHNITDKMPKKDKKKAKKDKVAIVPEGYANVGSAVPLGRRSFVAPELRTTTTLTGKEITTQFTSTFVDQGWSAPVSLGTRIVETAMAEFIRERYITFTARGFMPGARLYPFFDDVDVSADCAPGVLIEGTNPSLADVLAFNAAAGSSLLCDSKGRVSGTFKIPNREGKKFKVGDRIFLLTTSPNNQQFPPPASSGEGKYTARGFIDVRQASTYSTRSYTVDRGASPSQKDISLQISETLTTGRACPKDPIAQSFFVYDQGGCFVTAIDIFFYKRPTGTSQPPVTLQLRALDDGGTPSRIVLPFGEVIKEAVEVITNNINLVNGTMTVTGYDNSDPANIPSTPENAGPWSRPGGTITSGDSFSLTADPAADMVPTRFYFDSPIYLQQNQSYCVVLISDSNEYNTWVAQSGPDVTSRDGVDAFRLPGDVNTEIGTKTPILKDPYIQGVFFKSQNGISWSEDQTIDMKFRIWKAQFDTAVNGEIEFVNSELPLKKLTLDPLETKTGSSLVRVLHPNHGLTANLPASKVVFSPRYDRILTGTLSSSGTTVTGLGTLFLTELVVGSFIQHPSTREQKKVTAITNNLSLTIESAFTSLQLLNTANVKGTSYIVPSGASLSGLNASTIFDFNGFEIELTEMDHYIIDVVTPATGDGRVGSSIIYASENKRFEELTLLTTPLALPDTSLAWNIQTTSSSGVNDSTTATYEVMARKNLNPNEKMIFDRPMHVSSYVNEFDNTTGPVFGPSQVGTAGLGDHKSLNIRAVLRSSNINLSPIIDVSRLSAALVSNRLDNPHGIAGDDVDPGSIINSVFDDYQCLPSPVVAPIVLSAAGLFWFTSSSGALTGTASGNAGSITVTGIGTEFLSELRVGDTIKEDNNDQERRVVSITSDTSLTVDIAYGLSFIGAILHIDPPFLKIKTGDPAAAVHISKLDIGKYLAISGATGTRNFSDKLITSVVYTPENTVADPELGVPKLAEVEIAYRTLDTASLEANAITITQKDRFIDEIAPAGGSCAAKYVSKKLSVARSSNALKVMFDASRHSSCTLELYYKLEPVNSTNSIDDINWIKAEFNLDIGGVVEPATPDANDSTNQFSSYEATLTALPAFVGAQTKLVMRGGNPARSPLIKNFRMIVLDE